MDAPQPGQGPPDAGASCCPEEFRCICNPNDVFDPPDPIPRAVEGCPAHRFRRAYQRFIEQNRLR